MSRSLANVDITTDTFLGWIVQTNKALDALTNEVITVSTLAAGGNGTVANTTGNAQLLGVFGSNTLVATDGLRGGNVLTSAELSIVSNTTVTGTYLRVGANVQLNAISVSVGNTETNVIANSSTLTIGANLVVNTSSLQIGNTTVNNYQNSSIIQVSNTSGIANVTATSFAIGTTLANSTVVSTTGVSASYANISGQTNTVTLYVTTSANVGVFGTTNGAYVNTTTINIGNTSSNVRMTGNLVSVSNSANLTSTTLTIGTTTVNSTSANVVTLTTNNAVFNTDYEIQVVANSNIGVTTGSPLLIYSFPKATYSSAKLICQVKNTGNTQTSEMVLAQDLTDAYLTVYGTVVSPSGANLGSFSVGINNANVELKFSQSIASSATKVVAHLIK